MRKVVRAGTEPKSDTRIFFNGVATFSPDTRFTLDALADVLELRLTRTLREKLSGTYGVRVDASLSKEPYANYQLAIAFGSAPERVDELTKAVFKEIANLKKSGPTAAELQEVMETQRRGLETRLLQNQFWLNTIASYDQNGWDIGGALSIDAQIKQMTRERVASAAKQYFDEKNYVQVTLAPVAANSASK